MNPNYDLIDFLLSDVVSVRSLFSCKMKQKSRYINFYVAPMFSKLQIFTSIVVFQGYNVLQQDRPFMIR